jgi:hypothetical protein
MRFEKLSKIFVLITIFFSIVSSMANAQVALPEQDEGGINFTAAVIDDRCTRERLADPNGNYAKFCSPDNNKEQYIICLNKAFPEESGFFGVFNLFKSRFKVTPETLPSLIRTVILTFFAVVGVTAFWMSLWGYFKWISALNDSPEDAEKVWKLFTNGIFGLIFSLAAIVLTWGLFYALGIRQNDDDFFQVGNEIADLLSLPCEDLGKDPSNKACLQFDYSCYPVAGGNCSNVPPDTKTLLIRNMPTNVGELDKDGNLIYTGGNPCTGYKN